MFSRYKKLSKKHRGNIEWAIFLGVVIFLYATGLHVEVIGRLQGLIVQTGLRQPDTSPANNNLPNTSYAMTLTTLDGQRVPLSNFQDKTVFLNFWATWCPPCIAEMPDIHTLYQHEAAKDVAFVMVSVDKDLDKLKSFLKRKGYTFPVYRLAGGVPAELYSKSVPTTIVIAPKGQLMMKHEGIASYNTQSFRNFLQQVNAGKPSALQQ